MLFHFFSFIINQVKNSSQASMQKSQTKQFVSSTTNKYSCGCGKTYTSYPAYSTHRKTKHGNVDVAGTVLPKSESPKRGRPSYQFLKNSEGEQSPENCRVLDFYRALSVIEIGLIRLNNKYEGKLISEAHHQETNTKQLGLTRLKTASGEDMQVQQSNHHSLLAQIPRSPLRNQALFGLFAHLICLHANQAYAKVAVSLMEAMAAYDEQQFSPRGSNYQCQQNRQLESDYFDMKIFNEFFADSDSRAALEQLTRAHEVEEGFLIDLCVIFSHWVFKMKRATTVIRVRNCRSD